MSTNLASILVGLGYDLSALEKGAPEAFRLVNEHTLGMSAEMKRASREGAESLRLIDESLGIHISLPLTRILTQEFPALASGLQAVMGGAVFGAVATVGVEAFEKISSGIEHAQKTQEDFEQSSRSLAQTFAEAMASYDKSEKLRSLSGIDKIVFQVDSRSVDEANKHVESLTGDAEKNMKAAVEAGSQWNQFWAQVGDAGHQFTSLGSTLGVEAIDKDLQGFRLRLQDIAIANQADPMKGLTEGLKAAQGELDKTNADLLKMTQLKSAADAATVIMPGPHGTQHAEHPIAGPSDKEMEAQTRLRDIAQEIVDLLNRAATDNRGAENEARKADSAERQLKAQEALAALQKDTGAVLGKFQPQTDPFARLVTEVNGLRMTAENDFRAISESSASMIDKDAAKAALDEIEKKLGSVVRSAQLDKQIADAQASLAKLPSTSFAPLATGIAHTPTFPHPRWAWRRCLPTSPKSPKCKPTRTKHGPRRARF